MPSLYEQYEFNVLLTVWYCCHVGLLWKEVPTDADAVAPSKPAPHFVDKNIIPLEKSKQSHLQPQNNKHLSFNCPFFYS